ELADIASSEGGNHELRKADRQLAHAGSDDGSAAAPTDADYARDIGAGYDVSCEGFCHRLNSGAAILAAEHEFLASGMERCDFSCCNAGFNLGGSGTDIDNDRGSAGRLDQRSDILQLQAFGISGADHVYALHRVGAQE